MGPNRNLRIPESKICVSQNWGHLSVEWIALLGSLSWGIAVGVIFANIRALIIRLGFGGPLY